jgi:hypothetical protein
VQKEITVPVTKCVPIERQASRTVCEMVPVQKEITVPVTTMQPQQQTGCRTVCHYETVCETVKQKQCYTEMEPYEQTVRVAVGGTSACGDCGPDSYSASSGGRRGLFFRR